MKFKQPPVGKRPFCEPVAAKLAMKPSGAESAGPVKSG
jgi:hypothetical protein